MPTNQSPRRSPPPSLPLRLRRLRQAGRLLRLPRRAERARPPQHQDARGHRRQLHQDARVLRRQVAVKQVALKRAVVVKLPVARQGVAKPAVPVASQAGAILQAQGR